MANLKIEIPNSLIHSRGLYSASSRLLLRGAPSPVTGKEEGLQREVKFGRVAHQKGPQLFCSGKARAVSFERQVNLK